ncbi:hypothetical protein [Occultella gossypii]|uniref:Nucleotidyltransferase domain-containing protein n=1 Tax=Occultella gossypii TaxID=2800820 RepID=A0ABS7S3R5_9MICO|nr:hypothetical protein [Occultella gossypii]MBZ2194985.1 hypothetical protein [Occultella gossypii]
MLRDARDQLTEAEQARIDAVLTGAADADGRLIGVYGQGSRFTGFATGSDLDLVLVWDAALPTTPLLTDATRHVIDPEHHLEVRRDAGDDIDVDLVHTTLGRLEETADRVESGEGWNTSEWPDPLYTVAGLAQSTLLHDPSGTVAELRSRVQAPTAMFRSTVDRTFRNAAPAFLAELENADRNGHHWLSHKLQTDLMRLAQVQLFARSGHYAPFPKHLRAWFGRLQIDRDVQDAERAVWEGGERLTAMTRLVELLSVP